MQLTLHKTGNTSTSKVDVADAVFAAEYNEALIHQAVVAFMEGARAGTKAQLTRSEVRGGGKKPWRQKGTGRARSGTIRSPIWRGGGVTFAAKPRKFGQKLNKKMYRGALRSILSELARQERLLIIDNIEPEQPKTKLMLEQLKQLGLQEVLIITDEITENLFLAARNIPKVEVIDTSEMDPYILVGFDKVLMTQSALQSVEDWLK